MRHAIRLPHESTSDQFFDEAQFESYRRLGEHVAQQVLQPALQQREQEFSHLCHALRSHWMTTPSGMQESFLGETDDLKDLERLLRDDPDLLRYDLEMYPELCSVFGMDPGTITANPRAALHTCNLQIQLMGAGLSRGEVGGFHGHALNRGWMNLFRRWTSSATFRLFWPALCGMYSQQFVRFAEQHLNLSIDEVARLEPLGTTDDLTSLFRELTIEGIRTGLCTILHARPHAALPGGGHGNNLRDVPPGKCVSRHSTRRPDRSARRDPGDCHGYPPVCVQGTGLDCTGGFARPTADWDLDTGCSAPPSLN